MRPRCQCTDASCPAHRGRPECVLEGCVQVYRTDEEDVAGLLLCHACADESMETGLYDTRDEEPDLYDRRDQC